MTNSCGDDFDDATVTVVDPPTAPASVAAVYNTVALRNDISWSASSSSVGISYYVVKRRPDNRTFAVSYPALSYSDQTALVAPKAYVYRVAAVDTNGISSANRGPDLAAVRVFTTDPLPGPGMAIVQAVHVSEVRSAVDAAQYAAGLPPAWSNYAPPVNALIYAADFTQLRDRLNEARSALGLLLVTFSAPVAPGQLMLGSTLIELRNGVK